MEQINQPLGPLDFPPVQVYIHTFSQTTGKMKLEESAQDKKTAAYVKHRMHVDKTLVIFRDFIKLVGPGGSLANLCKDFELSGLPL